MDTLASPEEEVPTNILEWLLARQSAHEPEEARTLIPSLEGKITDEDLQPVLDNIAKLRVFT